MAASSTIRRPLPYLLGYALVILAAAAIVATAAVLMVNEIEQGLGRSTACPSADHPC